MGKRISAILKGQLVTSVIYILLGLGLIFAPVQMIDLICKVVFGLVLIGSGVYHLYIYLREKANATVLDLFTGVIVLVLGGFLFFNPLIVVKLLPLLLGAFVLVDSIWSLRGCRRLYKQEKNQWKILLAGSLIFIALGVVLLVNPFSGVKGTMIFAGWVILCNGILDIVFMVIMRNALKEKLQSAQVEGPAQWDSGKSAEENRAAEDAAEEGSTEEKQAAESSAGEARAAESAVEEEMAAEYAATEARAAEYIAEEEQAAEERAAEYAEEEAPTAEELAAEYAAEEAPTAEEQAVEDTAETAAAEEHTAKSDSAEAAAQELAAAKYMTVQNMEEEPLEEWKD